MRKQIPRLFGKAANGIWRQLTPKKEYAPVYHVGDWLTELQALTTGFFWPPDVLHVLYDSQLYLLARRRKLLRCR